MPLDTAEDAVWEPFRHVLKVKLTSSQLNHLNRLVASLGVSRSWIVRRALQAGLPAVVSELRGSARRDLLLRAARGRRVVRTPRRGPRVEHEPEVYLARGDLVEVLPVLEPVKEEQD